MYPDEDFADHFKYVPLSYTHKHKHIVKLERSHIYNSHHFIYFI